jgi:hypothetical protein
VIEQLPPELASLFEAERAAPPPTTAVRELVRAKLAASIAGAPLGVGASLGVGKLLTILVLVLGAGTVAVMKLRPASSTPAPATTSPAPVAHVEPWELQHDLPDPPPVVVEPVEPVEPAVAAPPAKPRVIVIAESELIRSAWTALSNHEPARALELAQRDEHDHPDGALAEERAAITIVALARLDRAGEANAAAETFSQHYPDSIHRDLVAKALTGDTP